MFEFFYAVEAVIRNRRVEHANLDQIEADLLKAMANVEDAWPKLIATRVFHTFAHAVDSLKLLGPFFAWAMWMFEKEYGYEIRKLRGHRNITQELAYNAMVKILTSAQTARMEESAGQELEMPPPKYATTPKVTLQHLRPFVFNAEETQLAHHWLLQADSLYKHLFQTYNAVKLFLSVDEGFELWQPARAEVEAIAHDTGCTYADVAARVGGVAAAFSNLKLTSTCEASGRALHADARSQSGPVTQRSCRSIIRLKREGEWEGGHEEWQQSGVPLAFWSAHVYGVQVQLVKVRLFSWLEHTIQNTELKGISVDGEGAEVLLVDIEGLNQASYVLCDSDSNEFDKILVGFETEW